MFASRSLIIMALASLVSACACAQSSCPTLSQFQQGDQGAAQNAAINIVVVGSGFSTQAQADMVSSIGDMAALPSSGFSVAGGGIQTTGAISGAPSGTAANPVGIYIVGNPEAVGCPKGSAACTSNVHLDGNGNVTQYTVTVLATVAGSASSAEYLYSHEASHGILGIKDCPNCANTLAQAGTPYTKPTSCDATFVKNNNGKYGGVPCPNCSATCANATPNNAQTCSDNSIPACGANGLSCSGGCLNPPPTCTSPQTAHCLENTHNWACYEDGGGGCSVVAPVNSLAHPYYVVPLGCGGECDGEVPPCTNGESASCSMGVWSCSGTACVGDTPTCPDGSAATCDYTGGWVCGAVTTSQCDGTPPCSAASCTNGVWDSSSCQTGCSDVCDSSCSNYDPCSCDPSSCDGGGCTDECDPSCSNYDPEACGGACECDYSCDYAVPVGETPQDKTPSPSTVAHPMCNNDMSLPKPWQPRGPAVATLIPYKGVRQHANQV